MIQDKCSSSFIGLFFFFSWLLARAYIEMLFEYFAEVFGIIETCHFCNFSYGMFSFSQ